ncbi:MAG: pimeloyl-ACP methyl ester carboxylesterase [Sphingobacteriales bacterium]|jgi:pimeloyl-ACP methyl ester carboxylesterase
MEFQLWYLWVIIGYIVVCVAIYYFQESFFFHPEKLSPDFHFKYDSAFREVNFEIDGKTSIHGLHFYSEYPKGIILYFHGNTRSVKGWGKYAVDFLRHYFDVVMIDYRGFGKSTGKRTEKTLFSDAQCVYDKVKLKFPENNIIIYGRSMGSGIAAELASKNNPSKLILDAPYYSFLNVTKKYAPLLPIGLLLRFHIRTDIFLQKVKCNTFIIHGSKDRLIPITASKKLRNIDPSRIILLPIKFGGHNNLPKFPIYHQFLEDILNDKIDPKNKFGLDDDDLFELTLRNN